MLRIGEAYQASILGGILGAEEELEIADEMNEGFKEPFGTGGTNGAPKRFSGFPYIAGDTIPASWDNSKLNHEVAGYGYRLYPKFENPIQNGFSMFQHVSANITTSRKMSCYHYSHTVHAISYALLAVWPLPVNVTVSPMLATNTSLRSTGHREGKKEKHKMSAKGLISNFASWHEEPLAVCGFVEILNCVLKQHPTGFFLDD